MILIKEKLIGRSKVISHYHTWFVYANRQLQLKSQVLMHKALLIAVYNEETVHVLTSLF